jgi:hypothetical protein
MGDVMDPLDMVECPRCGWYYAPSPHGHNCPRCERESPPLRTPDRAPEPMRVVGHRGDFLDMEV